jgi:hypothetical protein
LVANRYSTCSSFQRISVAVICFSMLFHLIRASGIVLFSFVLLQILGDWPRMGWGGISCQNEGGDYLIVFSTFLLGCIQHFQSGNTNLNIPS